MLDFGDCDSTDVSFRYAMVMADITELIRYMELHKFRLGYEFHFIMGTDAPFGNQFAIATMGPSMIVWDPAGQKRGIWPTKYAEEVKKKQYIYKCLEMIREDKNKADHLEVIEDIA